MGDPAGIGPEIVTAAAARSAVRRACRLVVYGDPAVMEAARAALRLARDHATAVTEIEDVMGGAARARSRHPRPGRAAGEAAFRYLEAAAGAAHAGDCDALVTAPINKYWLHRAGHTYDGHTGYLAELAGRPAVMMLAGRRLRVILVTTHIAHADVSSALTAARIRQAARVADAHLRRFHGLARPRLAVAALNPHAGEGGLFGDEEKRTIAPAVRALARAGLQVEGPLPADTLFAAAADGDYDAVVCMYHDQALIPVKLLEFGRAVNVSMGLPFIRTSPDHGTAYELAGTGKARADSMAESMLAAAAMSSHAGSAKAARPDREPTRRKGTRERRRMKR